MTKSADLLNPAFANEKAAIAHLEASRWPDGVNCPHCGSVNVHRMGGETQAGMFQCNDCRDKFTARTGTVMERSHVPVHKWLLAIHLLNQGKNGASAHEIHRSLGITYKTAWFLCHRIREAMIDTKPTPMGGKGKSVQADETYYGNSSKRAKGYKKGHSHKQGVVALVEPKGRTRVFSEAPAWLLKFTAIEWDTKLLGFKLRKLIGTPALGRVARLDRNKWPFLPEGTIDAGGPCSEPDEPWEKIVERRCHGLR